MEHPSPPTPSWGLSSCILIVLLITMHSCNVSLDARATGNETDRLALLDMKLHMNDPNGVLNTWNDSQHHCQWLGVSCGKRHRRVTALTLQGKALSGTISPHIGNLSFMKVIHLEENSVYGEIPHQIGQLSRLRIFYLSDNLVNGEIPINLSRCSNLKGIFLSKNQLTGKIPVELWSLTNLETFAAAANNLTGEIPASIGNLSSSLIRLSLGDNSLGGHLPSEFGSLSRLSFLGLGPNKLGGEIPSSLFNISTLTIFSVTDNYLSGKLPNNPGLQGIGIGGNNFFGEIPVSITNCTNLEVLDLSENKFEGKVPPSVGQLLNLQLLNLEMNSLHGNIMDILAPLTNCTHLLSLSLGANKFSGHFSSIIGNLSTQLTKLYLYDNKISGTIPVELKNLVSLKGLILPQNSLTGVIPANLAKLQNLQALVLFSNRLSGYIPPTLCNNMTNLYALELYDNNLGGDLNHGLSNCLSLQGLLASGNKFSGSIPSHMFGSYTSPTHIDLSSNSLSGILPFEIGNMANLQQLNVSYNKLSGHIPSTIGGCSVIEFLFLSSNRFSGLLPPSLANLKGIKQLDLSDNTLTGPIPSGLSQLLYLNHLNLSYNDLEDEVPCDGVFLNVSQIMLQGNSRLCGGISELGLPACPLVHTKIKGKKHLKIILIPLLSALVISITLFLYLFRRRQKSDRVREGMPSTPSEKMLRVSYHDLYRATNEFSLDCLLGSGSFGFVYKGSFVVDHGEIKVVAVKVLDLQKRGASKSFKAECKALSNLRHRNLVPLLTYCSSIDSKGDEFKALVYKFMENGSLDSWLHPDQPHEPPRCLNLVQRLNIAIDVASALDHLHNHSHIAVAHCDIKPTNILLDNELTAYVGDFGLARLLPQLQQGGSSSTVAIKGTIGYAAPEYAMGLEVSTQGDVYSYGILLLEMFTGRRPTDDAFTEGLDLHNYVKMGLYDQVWKIVDPSLLSREAPQVETRLKEQESLISILKLGFGCSQGAAKDRMDMKQVTRELYFIRGSLQAC